MKKAVLVISILFFLVGTVLFSEQEKTGHRPILEDFGGFHYACIPVKGPYTLIGENMDILQKEFEKQGLKAEGDIMVVFYNSPRENKKEDLEWAVSFPIAADAEVKPPLKKVEFQKTQCVTIIHTGPIRTIQESNDRVSAYIADNGFETVWPAYEIFYSNPKQVKIINPVKKK